MSQKFSLLLEELRSDWRFCIIGIFFGIFVALIIFLFSSNRFYALSVVQLGGIVNQVPRGQSKFGILNQTEEEIAIYSFNSKLAEKVQTAEFSRDIAKKLKDPSLASLLRGKRYGGHGRLKARLVGDDSLLEITASGTDRSKLLKIVETSADMIVNSDRDMLSSIYGQRSSQIKLLEDQQAIAIHSLRTLSKIVGKDESTSTIVDRAAHGISSSLSQLVNISNQIEKMQKTLYFYNPDQAKIFVSPVIVKPAIHSWWLVVLLGLIGGGSIGYVLGVFFKNSEFKVDDI